MTRPCDDHYPTPPEATRAILSVERFGGGIWEPCAGSGDMAAVLRQAGYVVAATTLHDGRHVTTLPDYLVFGGQDFLTQPALLQPNIVTNPPYRIAEQIIRHALSLRPVKVAMLLNIKFWVFVKVGCRAPCCPSMHTRQHSQKRVAFC